jgi:hypothetical protein
VRLRPIGSRSTRVTPDAWGVKEHSEDALTAQLFVAGRRDAFETWRGNVQSWTESEPGATQLAQLESISSFAAVDKSKNVDRDSQNSVMLEVVLHNARSELVVAAFIRFAAARGAEPLVDHRRDIQGLTFMPVRVSSASAEELAAFSFVRVARGMPTLRPFRPTPVRNARSFSVRLPSEPAIDGVTRAVIFDGGLPATAQPLLSRWVRYIEPLGIGKAVPEFEAHGLGVTTAFLFGPLAEDASTSRPVCLVDHVRVLDDQSGKQLDYYDVIERITKHLDEHAGAYKLVNVSLGPDMAVDDDEVTLWTASLDRRFAHENVLATVAAGNDGERDARSGLNRVQPPADGVNVLSIGATDTTGIAWSRASYSCVGPGRCPGIIKPDGVIFGGSATAGFGILDAKGLGTTAQGTSFAAPYALRSAAAVRAQLDERLNPLAIRALLIHSAEEHEKLKLREIGWGRLEEDELRLVTSVDYEAVVVYQGQLPIRQHLRARVPLPRGPLRGRVYLTATLVIAPQVDPEHPDAYTRGGLECKFRPNARKFGKRKDGTATKHAKPISFFSKGRVYGESESVLREGAHKWEPCLKATRDFAASSLAEPVFDIYYHDRDAGHVNENPLPVAYALIVGIKAPKVEDLYRQVVREYKTQLTPLRPQNRIRAERRF